MKLFRIIIFVCLILIMVACSPNIPITPTETPEPTNPPTIEITQTPTQTPLELSPEYFSLPVVFEGPYSLGNKLRYSPCYHWDQNNYDANKITNDNWYQYFHAGDMYILKTTNKAKVIVALSPISGRIIKSEDFGQGLIVSIKTDYYLEGKQVFVDIAHMDELFPGDEKFPRIDIGSQIKQGQPIGLSKTVWIWGRPEQALDIGLRNGPEGANPMYSNFAPNSYIDPFPYLKDDLEKNSENIVFDKFRSHCLKGGNFPK
jgi:hypothetical protein